VPVSLTVIGVGIAFGAALALWAKLAPDSTPNDPEVEEEAVVAALERRPAVVRFFHRVGSRIGGSMLVVGAFVTVVLLGALAGGILDMVRAGSGFARWDEAVASWGAAHATAFSTIALTGVTQLGSSWIAIPVALLIGWYGYQRWDSFNALGFMATVVVGHIAISNLLKFVVERDRPPVEHLVGTISSSFPSTHSGTAAAVWAASALVIGADRGPMQRAALGISAATLAGAVAASRALLGVHWLTDVMAGFAIGLAWFILVAISFGGRALRLGEPVDRVRNESIGGRR
jgi:membrane-associated phospholipid phosphatase